MLKKIIPKIGYQKKKNVYILQHIGVVINISHVNNSIHNTIQYYVISIGNEVFSLVLQLVLYRRYVEIHWFFCAFYPCTPNKMYFYIKNKDLNEKSNENILLYLGQ